MLHHAPNVGFFLDRKYRAVDYQHVATRAVQDTPSHPVAERRSHDRRAKALKGSFEILTERRGDISLLLLLVAIVFGFSELSHSGPFGARLEMIAIARNLADHGAFANPYFSMKTGPTAANPPLYPAMLALLMKAVKTPAFLWFGAACGSIMANALTAAWLPQVSFVFFGDAIPGIFASVFWMGSMQVIPSWDTSYTVAGLLLFCLVTAKHVGKSNYVVGFGITAGVVAGCLLLLNPSSVMILIPWLMYLYVRMRIQGYRGIKYYCVVMAVLCLFAFGWMGRNYRQLGGFVMRTNLGLTLYASNNDCAQSSMIQDQLNHCYQGSHPNTSVQEAQMVVELGEIKYDRMRIAATKSWIMAHPQRFASLTMRRMREFWFPPLNESQYTRASPQITLVIWIVTGLSIPGILWMASRRERVTLFVVAALAAYPVMYYVVVSDVRYRYPLLWLSLLPAGYLLWQILLRVRTEVGLPPLGVLRE